MPEWAVARTPPNSEHKAFTALTAAGFDAILPLHWERRRYRSRRPNRRNIAMDVQAPAFPGYVFMDLASAETIAPVHQRGLLLSFLTQTPGRPYILPPHAVAALKAHGAAIHTAPSPTGFGPGDRVTIVIGPLAGVQAEIEATDGDMLGLRVPGVVFRVELHAECCDVVECPS